MALSTERGVVMKALNAALNEEGILGSAPTATAMLPGINSAQGRAIQRRADREQRARSRRKVELVPDTLI